ncbi:MAG: M48 family metalloprotease [Candidatus Omnitrophota bacterium]
MNEKTILPPGKAKRYSLLKAWFSLLGILTTAVSPWVFWFFFSEPVFKFAGGLSVKAASVYAVYIFVFLFFVGLVSFPLQVVDSFIIERRYGLSSRGFASWMLDVVKASSLSMGFSIVSLAFFYASIYHFPGTWWLISVLAWAGFSVLMVFLSPLIIIPFFFKYLPLDPDVIKNKIMDLSKKTGIIVNDVCRVDLSKKTLKANAALVGIGKTRKVILADTLTENFTPDEVEVVIAHEFGHHKGRHIMKLMVFSGFWAFLGFFLLFLFSGRVSNISGTSEMADVRTLPVIFFLVCVYDILILPLRNFYLRYLEKEADDFALDITSRPGIFIAVMEKLASMNLADCDPPFLRKIFLYTHPPISERIAMARRKPWKERLAE